MPGDLSVVNARLVVPEVGVIRGSLRVRDGQVLELRHGEDTDRWGDEVIDAEGRYLLPGILDAHVHSGLLPPLGDRLQAESAFAASGGVTTVLRYFRRPESYLGTLPAQVELGARRQYQDFTHHLVLFTPEQAAEMDRYVRDFGVTSFKLYMNLRAPFGTGFLMDLLEEDTEELSFADVDFNDGHLYDVFRRAARLRARVRINVHSEDAEIVMRETAAVQESGLGGLPAWDAARPGDSEAMAIQMVAYLSRRFRVPVYYPHIGSREAVQALADVQAAGVDYGAETGPQYVALSTESPAGPLAKVMPPVRTKEDAERVWRGLRNGVLTSLGSDHIAYTLEEKQPGTIWSTRPAFGGTGLLLPVFLSEGVNAGRITIQRLAEVGSYQTARLFGLYPRKGTLLPGADADFVLVDTDEEWEVRADDLLSASDFSSYEGMMLRGSVVLTAVRGTVVYREGEMRVPPGHGRYYRRHPELEARADVG